MYSPRIPLHPVGASTRRAETLLRCASHARRAGRRDGHAARSRSRFDTKYRTDFAILLRDHRGDLRVVHDSHIEGVFQRAEWMRLLGGAGFEANTLTDKWGREIFVAKRPG